MSCRSCWTYPQQESSPRPLRRPVSSHITAAVSDEASHPAEHRGSPVPLTPWQLVTCVHPTPSLPPSACLFTSHSTLISSPVFFKASQKERADDLHELACDSHTHTLLIPLRFIRSFLFPLFLYTGSLFSSVSLDPASSVILTLRSQSATPPILLESSALSPVSCLCSLCSAICRRQIVEVHYWGIYSISFLRSTNYEISMFKRELWFILFS